MKKLKLFIQYFVSITTGILIVSALSYALSERDSLPKNILLHILLCGFVTAVDTMLLFPTEAASKKQTGICILLHFISLCVIVSFFGVRFTWFAPSWKGILNAVLSVTLVYAFTFGVNYIIETQQAKQMNSALRKKYPQEDGDNEK